jgi:hypothetical protein
VLVSAHRRDSGILLRLTHEMAHRGRRPNSVTRDRQAAIAAVLESDGEGETEGQLAVELGLARAGDDGAEGDQVGEELQGDGVEHFACDGHAGGCEVAEELSRDPEALVGLVGLVDVGVVDQALPADGGS